MRKTADSRGLLVTVRRSKTDQEGTAADVRYLKNGAAAVVWAISPSTFADDAPVLGGLSQSIALRIAAAAKTAGIDGRITGRAGPACELTARGARTTETMLAAAGKPPVWSPTTAPRQPPSRVPSPSISNVRPGGQPARVARARLRLKLPPKHSLRPDRQPRCPNHVWRLAGHAPRLTTRDASTDANPAAREAPSLPARSGQGRGPSRVELVDGLNALRLLLGDTVPALASAWGSVTRTTRGILRYNLARIEHRDESPDGHAKDPQFDPRADHEYRGHFAQKNVPCRNELW